MHDENRVYLACQSSDWIRKGHLDNDGSIKFLRERCERDQTSQLAMGGGDKLVSLMIDNLLHLKVNTIVVVLVATTIPWLSVSVQGLTTDQAENQLGSLSAPEEALVNHYHCQ